MSKVKVISLSAKETPTVIFDNGRVRLGNLSPAFPMVPPLVRGRPLVISDTGEVRIDEFRPADNSASTAGEPNVRIATASATLVRRK
jgi:hypothetical protein